MGADNQSQLDILIKTVADAQGITLTREQMAALKTELGKTTDATGALGAETERTTEKFVTNRREVRAAFNELTQAFGLGRMGGLVAGGFFAALTAMAVSVEFL